MSKAEKKEDKPLSLRELMDKAEKRRLCEEVVEMKAPVLESERVLNAESGEQVLEIVRHVRNCRTVFVTPDHPDLAPILPPDIMGKYLVPEEITAPRERTYFIDADGFLREIDCDVRQEYKLGLYKQTTKVGKGGTEQDSTMDRMEQASKIKSFGFNVYAVGDKDVRETILRNAISRPKPGLRMLSQRIRLPYHPEGDSSLLIEMALEPIHVGQTFTGFVWERPKIDLEIKIGPKNKAQRHAILAREEERLMLNFPFLKRQLQSSPTPGFEEITDALHKASVRQRFEQLGVNEQFWKDSEFKQSLAA